MPEPAPPTILSTLIAHATTDPERPCLRWDDTTFSYAEVVSLAANWAASYTELGLGRGDRVGLYLPSGPAFVAAYLGAHMAGAAVVLINTQYRKAELEHILTDSLPKLVVCTTAERTYLSSFTDPLEMTLIVLNETDVVPLPGKVVAPPEHLPTADDLAILAYTSGTTGRAKAAQLTHGCLAANIAAVVQAWAWTQTDRLLLVLPLFHIHGLGVGVHGTLWSGASFDLRPRFEPDETLAALASGSITMFFGVPTIYTRLIQAGRTQPGAGTLAQLRLFVSGSAPLAPQTLEEFATLFGQRILERYGMTETGMNLTNPYQGERRAGTVGMPFPGQQARVVDVQTRAPLPEGTIGEIQVRGSHVCAGYWRNQAATDAVFHADGWFSTGDLGWRSADGYYTLTGRARELIITGGYNVYPREVEEVLLSHPAIAECAVFGLPDADLGEQVVAAIVPDDPAHLPSDEALAQHCREQLAAYKRPRTLYFVDALPRNAMGKVQKHTLKAQLG